MSEEPGKPKTHSLEAHFSASANVSAAAAVLRVTRPEELAPALAQRDKVVLIENDEIGRKFVKLDYFQLIRLVAYPDLNRLSIKPGDHP